MDFLMEQHLTAQIQLLQSAAQAELAKTCMFWALGGLTVLVAILLPVTAWKIAKRRRVVEKSISDADGGFSKYFHAFMAKWWRDHERNHQRTEAFEEKFRAGCRHAKEPIIFPENK